MAWVILAHGCAPAGPGAEADVAAILARARSESPAGGAGVVAHDYGPMLARGQELRHAFAIENPTDRPWRIVGAEALTPCCSAVGPLPEAIAPGATGEVPVLFRPGNQSGPKRVEFVVRVDDPARPLHRFALTAALVAELEVRPHAENPATLPLNAAGTHRYTVVCRRLPPGADPNAGSPAETAGSEDHAGHPHPHPPPAPEGLRAPDALTAAPPLSARFLGPATERTLDDGVIEVARDFEVQIPPSTALGARRAEVRLAWPDGRDRPQVIAWQVTPRIQATPPGVVLRPSASGEPERVTVTVRSEDQPFRITAAAGPALAEPCDGLPTEPSRVHVLKLALTPTSPGSPGTSDIRIATDHPDQPGVEVSVLVLPAAGGGE